MNLSIIIPYHNEGFEFIKTTINQIQSTIDIDDYEIIVVDDCSDIPLVLEDVIVIRHAENKGVGQAFDTGVKYAQSDNLLLIGADIRFTKNGWASKIIKEIENNQKSLICTCCVGLNETNLDFEERRKVMRLYGADILMYHSKKNDPSKSESYRNIIEAKWAKSPIDFTKSYEIPCVLGAAYGIRKTWYTYIDGFALHRQWGTLEPYISLKSYYFGGNCLVAPHIEVGHIFKDPTSNFHSVKQDHIYYNKLMIVYVLNLDLQLVEYLPSNSPIIQRARNLINNNWNYILEKKNEYLIKIKNGKNI